MDVSTKLKNNGIGIVVFIYVILSIVSLTFFPFMHSDEGWLASLSRSMIIERDIGATEDFFPEASRNPHAIKSLFHIIQIPFITTSFSLISVRILSFIVGLFTLFFFFKSSLSIFNNKRYALLITLLLALDIQFIYISHFARQEIFILLIFSICLWVFYRPIKKWTFKNDILGGTLIGISIGFHPNIFIIATGFIFIYIFYSIFNRITKCSNKPTLLNTLLYVFILGLFGLLFIGISQLLDPEFISNYLNFGADHGVTNSLYTKLLKLPRFYEKMFSRISGTYYLPDIKLQLIVFTVSFFLLIPATLIFRKKEST
ncbi:MAG: glycosyltransferase family 39 protein, partial [Spirochaetales bacterium]|nr:glycosyltransferase family 39 protein [Spirochaetales bacterium]